METIKDKMGRKIKKINKKNRADMTAIIIYNRIGGGGCDAYRILYT